MLALWRSLWPGLRRSSAGPPPFVPWGTELLPAGLSRRAYAFFDRIFWRTAFSAASGVGAIPNLHRPWAYFSSHL